MIVALYSLLSGLLNILITWKSRITHCVVFNSSKQDTMVHRLHFSLADVSSSPIRGYKTAGEQFDRYTLKH